jgi:hypothetical protein
MSVRMLKLDETARHGGQLGGRSRRRFRRFAHWSVLTVKEGRRVDAFARDDAGKVPHLVQGLALGERCGDADDEEGGVEGNCAVHQFPNQLAHGYPKVHAQNGYLDACHNGVVEDLDRQCCLHKAQHVVEGEGRHGKPDAVLLQLVDANQVANCPRHGCHHESIVKSKLPNHEPSEYHPDRDEDSYAIEVSKGGPTRVRGFGWRTKPSRPCWAPMARPPKTQKPQG